MSLLSIEVNGKSIKLDQADLSLKDFLKTQSLDTQRIAIELNQSLVPRSQFPSITLKSGDRLEIVAAIGGG